MSERAWAWPDTPTAQQNLEVLSALTRAIGMASPGRFVLLLAKCNLPAQRGVLAERLRAMLEPLGIDLVEVGLDRQVDDLLSHLKVYQKQARHHSESIEEQQIEPTVGWPSTQLQPTAAVAESRPPYTPHPPFAISVYGLEPSLRSDALRPPLLAHLNLARERYRELGCPLILWLPDYALTRLAQEAPDFWAWRSGVFEFAAELEVAQSALWQIAYEPDLATSSLDAVAKRERLALLRQLLADYRELGKEPEGQDAQADILRKMGDLHQDLGEYNTARQTYQEALKLKQRLGKEHGIAGLFHQLGTLDHDQGNYDEAHRLYQESLDIAQQLGDRAGLAATLHQLGRLAQDQGDYDKAYRLYQESLDITEQLNNRIGAGKILHQMGMLALDQGKYDEARRLYQESLETDQQLGNRDGVAKTLHELGRLAQKQGDYNEARRLYQQSLKIKHQLGSRASAAITLAQLALLEEAESNIPRALELAVQAEDIFTELHSPNAIRVRSVRQRLERRQQSID